MSRHPSSVTLLFIALVVAAPLFFGPALSIPVAQAAGTFVVTTADDTAGSTCGATCSLRQAINAANNANGGTIQFDIPPSSPAYQTNGLINAWRITLSAANGALPALRGNVIIDGTTQESNWPLSANPLGPEIIIDGVNLSNLSGLRLNGNANIVQSVAVVNFNSTGSSFGAGVGIDVITGANNQIRGSFIGVDQISPSQIGGNGFAGIWIESGATNTIIGGSLTDQLQFNVISGNDLDGIVVQGSGTRIRGNYIGTDRGGRNQLPNNGAGILIRAANDTIVGSTTGDANVAYRNLISGNATYGVVIDGGQNNRIAGNYIGIGVNALGQAVVSLPNGSGGIEIRSDVDLASGNSIGLPSAGGSDPFRNFIAGNTGPGIRLRGSSTENTTIVNNWVGLNDSGTPLASNNNTGGGIIIGEGVTGVTIGGASAADRNVISGNAGDGIVIQGLTAVAPTSNNSILGNYIGTNTAGSFTVSGYPNRSGIVVGDYVRDTTIGGAAANRIGFNLNYGVAITGTGVLTTTLAGNTIRYNGLDGVYAIATTNLTVEGAGSPSLIGDNGRYGVRVTDSALLTFSNLTLSNNTQHGLYLTEVVTTTIDSVTASVNNDGARIEGATDTTIDNSSFVGNRDNGITFTDGVTTTISNVLLQLNADNGLALTGPLVNTTIASTQVISNSLRGIVGVGAMDLLIVGPNNTITGNGGTGMDFTFSAGTVPLRDIAIGSNTFNRNAFTSAGYGLRVVGAPEAAAITANTVDNTVNGGGIAIENANQALVDSNTARYNNGAGILVTTGSLRTQVANSTLISNTVGIQISGATTDQTVVQANTITNNGATGSGATGSGIGVYVLDAQRTEITNNSSIIGNLGAGIHVRGTATQTLVRDNTITNNARGVLVGAPVGQTDAVYPQQTRIVNNSISGNGIPAGGPFPVDASLLGRGIVLNPETNPGGLTTNPNNDIDPPASLRMSATGVLSGTINPAAGAGNCAPVGQTTCLIQVFRPNQTTRDGQGQEFAGQTSAAANGSFAVNVGAIPRQLTLTATDPVSNTSRFVVFTPTPSLSISAPQSRTADPGEQITYTHTVQNNGNLELANVQLTVTTSRGWQNLSPPISIQPSGSFSLAPGAQREVTITLRVPTGGGAEAAPGDDVMTVRVDGTTVSGSNTYTATASLVNTTTVNPRIVLELTPPTAEGRGDPGVPVPYAFQVRNTGNVQASVNLAAAFDDPVVNINWQAALSVNSLVIPAGATRSFQLTVTVPPEGSAPVAGTAVGTTITMTPTSPVDPTQVRTARVTTRVGQISRARIEPASDEKPGAADETVIFVHEVTNLGNGADIFQIVGTANLGSNVTFALLSGGTIDQNGFFNIGANATVQIKVEVKVNALLKAGDVEDIFIELKDRNQNNIGGAFAQDRVLVTRGLVRPWLWVPVITR